MKHVIKFLCYFAAFFLVNIAIDEFKVGAKALVSSAICALLFTLFDKKIKKAITGTVDKVAK